MEAKIGLEIHVQLTESGSKLFCGCRSNYRGLLPNTNVCPVCLGMPGALPVVQPRPLELAVAASLALSCRMPSMIVFTRKHYFYPDLPKNYQITEYEGAHGAPVCLGAEFRYLDPASWEWRKVRIRRINLEEDPGRSIYPDGGIIASPRVLVDYNRSGVPLLEIVTEPDLRGPRDARSMVEFLLLTLEYIGATNPRLEGAFRVDANISVAGGERVEVKNIGSTLELERAIRYEILRQRKIVEKGGKVERETRHWDSLRGMTKPLRHKEWEEEYLYFPDPDLPPIPLTISLKRRARRHLALNPYDVLDILLNDGTGREAAWSIAQAPSLAKLYLAARDKVDDRRLLARLIGVDLKGAMKEKSIDYHNPDKLPPADSIIVLLKHVEEGRLPYDTIKGVVIPRLVLSPYTPVEQLIPPPALVDEDIVLEVLSREARAVCDYLSGKKKALNYLVGAVIRRVGKRAVDPRQLREIILRVIHKNRWEC